MENGDYVRTKYGIAKIEEIKPDKKHNTIWYTVDKAQYHCFLTREQEIIKSSPNIIDLIEVEDLVTLTSKYCENEVYRVIHTFKDNNDTIVELDCFKDGTMFISKSEDIKSIVTREQFSSMEYKVK